MPVSNIPMPCVSQCRLDFIHAGNLISTCSVSNPDPINPDRLKTGLWFSSRTRDRNVILRAFTQTEPSERLTPLALMGFAVTVTQFLKLWVASITFANVRKGNIVLQMKTLWGQKGREIGTNYVDLTCEKKITLSLRCGSVSGSFTCARIMRKSLLSDRHFPTNVLWALRTSFSHLEGRVVWLRTMWYKSTRKFEREIGILPTDFQKYIRFTLRFWRLHEKIRRGKQTVDSTPENVNMQFPFHKRYNYHTAFKLLFGSWIRMWLNLTLCSVHSKEML